MSEDSVRSLGLGPDVLREARVEVFATSGTYALDPIRTEFSMYVRHHSLRTRKQLGYLGSLAPLRRRSTLPNPIVRCTPVT